MVDYLYLVGLEVENESVEGKLLWKVENAGEGLLLYVETSATLETQGRWGVRETFLTHVSANCLSHIYNLTLYIVCSLNNAKDIIIANISAYQHAIIDNQNSKSE